MDVQGAASSKPTAISLRFPYMREIAIGLIALISIGALLNLIASFLLWKWRGTWGRTCCLVVTNLAWIDVLVSGRDVITLARVLREDVWPFEESVCSQGLKNVVYLVVGGTTIFAVFLEKSGGRGHVTRGSHSNLAPLMYLMIHCSLSYVLAITWSKFDFISRKAFCRMVPRDGASPLFPATTFIIFLVPVWLFSTYFAKPSADQATNNNENNDNDESDHCDNQDVQAASDHSSDWWAAYSVLFLLCWVPYTVEGYVSSRMNTPMIVSIICSIFPIIGTSILPMCYLAVFGLRRRAQARLTPTLV